MTDENGTTPQEREPHQDELELDERQLQPWQRTIFSVSDVAVLGIEETRFPDDHEVGKLRGKVRQSAEVQINFKQMMQIPTTIPTEDGILKGTIGVPIAQYIARSLEPDFAIKLGKYLQEEGERVKGTMKEKPLKTDLVVARGEQDVEAAARVLDPEHPAGNGTDNDRRQ